MSFKTPTHCRETLLVAVTKKGMEIRYLIKEARKVIRPLKLALAVNVIDDAGRDNK